jgi:hypothetical protein
VSLWRRGLLTGICPACQRAPSPEVKARLGRICRNTLTAAILFALVAVGYCTPIIRAPLFDTRFSSEEWLRGDAGGRDRMARDLVSSRRLMWKSPEDVRSILGVPDVERFDGQTIRFRVDAGYRWVIRPYLSDLVVRFGKDDEVFQVAIEPREEAEPSVPADGPSTCS